MTLAINGVDIDDAARPYVVAELSGNHGQNYDQAERLVAAAAEAGADAVKVQTFVADDLCVDMPFPYGHDEAHDAWARNLGVVGMRDLFALGGFPRAWHAKLKRFAATCGVEFLSTPFSVDAARFLVNDIGVPALKIASGDLTFTPLLEYAAMTDLPLIVSTGGATMAECATALYGPLGRAWALSNVVMLHCCSVYPAADAMINLHAISEMEHTLSIPIGFSDHTLSYDVVPALAVAMGATVYEKHLTISRADGGVDAAHSLEPREFARMVEVIRNTPAILGSGVKGPHARELHDRTWARRSEKDFLRPTECAREGAWE